MRHGDADEPSRAVVREGRGLAGAADCLGMLALGVIPDLDAMA